MTDQLVFHVGFHKTGSTWLQKRIFQENMQFNLLNNFVKPWTDDIIIYLVKTNILEFDIDFFRELVNKKYVKDKINIVSAERLSGHPYSGGFDAEVIARKIQMAFPDSKILIVSREAEAFKKSCYKQIVKEGYLGRFSDFDRDKSWKSSGPNNTYFQQDLTINLYTSLFKSVLLLDFEVFIKNKVVFMNRLFDFCNLENTIDSTFYEEKINKTVSNRRIRALRVLNRWYKSEYNMFPLVSLNYNIIIKLAYINSIFFSNKGFK
ncbi:hypothetical protein [Winogradskyella helgolandensis]|uniref:hypothetical protein n=1 Tax=Winogradskyella helgolandensis TaxID=2697010 RepID=UPI0015CCEBCF|nr:hypothetical protein [Winogradskyella helgolandensis]